MFEGEYSNFIFLESEGFVFSYVPKAACTNWKCLLRQKLGYADWLDPHLAHDRSRSALPYLNTHADPLSVIESPTIKKYTMVRNPYSRVLSAFLDKIARYNSKPLHLGTDAWYPKVFEKVKNWGRHSVYTDDEHVSFPLFLQWLAYSGDLACEDEHWVPQAKLLGIGQVHFDVVGRFESLSSHAPKLMNMMGMSGNFPSQRDVKFPGTSASDLLSEYYGEEEIELVKRLYSEDFKLLRY